MKETITGFAYQLIYLFTHLTSADVLDIVLVAAAFFLVFQVIRQTRASQMLRGIIIVVILGVALLNLLPLNTFNWLLRSLLVAGVVALPIIFQDELRRALTGLGQIGSYRKGMAEPSDQLKKAIIPAATQLAARRVGALIVLEGKTSLEEIIESGIPLQADVLTKELLVTLFHPNTPLHDGAVIVRGNRLMAASCILPIETEKTGERHLGTRHRAAIGLSSQVPDALVIVVSEERGIVSVARGGRLHQDLSIEQVENWLDRFHDQLEGRTRSRWRWLRGTSPATSLRNLLIALVLALIAWVSVIYQTDPPQQITLTDVSLNVTAPVSDLVLMSDVPETINVQVQTTQDRLAVLGTESVHANLNLAELKTGTHQVPIEVTLADPRSQLISLSPGSLDVILEPYATLTLAPTIMIPDLDSLPLGYAVGDLSLYPEAITVQGPLSLVERVVEARAEITLNGRRTDFQQTPSLVLFDVTGQLVEGLHLSPDTILVEVPIQRKFHTREIAIQPTLDTEGLEANFRVTSALLSPTFVTLIGDREAVDNAGSFLVTAPINLAHVIGDLIVNVPLLLPDETQAINAQGESVASVVAHVTVEPITTYLVLTLTPTFSNLSTSLSLEQLLPDEINVLLIGPQPLVDEVRAEPGLVAIFLDLDGYESGLHTLLLEVQAPEGLRVELFPPQVQIILVEVEE